LPPHIDIIDPTDAVIRQTLRLMQQHGLPAASGPAAHYRFASTGQPDNMAHFLQHTLGTLAQVAYLDLPG
ncbi:MAG: glutamate racemase, partial [Vogesella sp.]